MTETSNTDHISGDHTINSEEFTEKLIDAAQKQSYAWAPFHALTTVNSEIRYDYEVKQWIARESVLGVWAQGETAQEAQDGLAKCISSWFRTMRETEKTIRSVFREAEKAGQVERETLREAIKRAINSAEPVVDGQTLKGAFVPLVEWGVLLKLRGDNSPWGWE